MASFSEKDKRLFPLKSVASVVEIFKNQLEGGDEPDLTLLSIVAGAFENSLTCRSQMKKGINFMHPTGEKTLPFVELDLETIEMFYHKFHTILKSAVDVTGYENKPCTRELIKKVSDVVWNTLTRGYYKDRAHLQSLYSYLTGNKLDCFGVAFAVVAGCQVLGFSDVHLALSEDHAWVVFGPTGSETSEVTWHGKGNEDKRGQDISQGSNGGRSWLYVNNRPVVCTRPMEVAALVSAINPSLHSTLDATEVATLQQELLWLLYDLGHLRKYPMAIGNLGDLEEVEPTKGRVPCWVLYEEAILSAKTYYGDHHVYPYTYQGGYFYRNRRYREALDSWANASDVIRLYNYSRDDEEIYKEFLEIANELIPAIMKVESSGFSANTILKKPECFANLLRFYDGICEWEEGSATPVLHIGWAKPLVNAISKFDADIRAQVNIICKTDDSTADDKTRSNGSAPASGDTCLNNNNNYCSLDGTEKEENANTENLTIEALTAGCSEKILNPDFLLQGGGSPFMGGQENKPNGTAAPSTSKQPQPEPLPKPPESPGMSGGGGTVPEIPEEETSSRPTIVLRSQKMKQLKELLLAEKLNTQAISLHLTAQSQVQVGKRARGEEGNVRPKRTRRD